MDITDYAKKSRLTLKALYWLVREKIISDPLKENDLKVLAFQEKLWGRQEFIKFQLKGFSKENRTHMIETCEFDTKWEAYAFSRISNLEKGERLSMKKLIAEIEVFFNFTLDIWQFKKIFKIRERVYNQRRYQKKLQESKQLSQKT